MTVLTIPGPETAHAAPQAASDARPSVAVLHTIAGLAAWAGGTSRTVTSLTSHLSAMGVSTSLLTIARPGETLVRPPFGDVRMTTVPPARGLDALRMGQIREAMERFIESHPAAVVHDHGIWLPMNHAVAAVCGRARSVQRVVSPEGMLEPWSLSFSKRRKQLAWALYQRRDLARAAAFQATAAAEAANIRKLGFTQPIALIPQGVSCPPDILARRRDDRDTRQALFLSRLHPKKGLVDLIHAWHNVQPKDWQLKIVGGEEVGHRRELESLIASLKLQDRIEIHDEVSDSAKWDVYARSDLFILPSYSENFGVVVVEALGAGVPVITTRATPWQELEERRCGWWIDTGVDALTPTLREATDASPGVLRDMGLRGANLVAERYSWTSAAASMTEFYRWLLGNGPKPGCVV